MKPFIVVAYYTIDTPYQDEVQGLIESCKQVGLEYDVVGLESRGSWGSNTHMKAEFILDMLDKHDDKNLLYVDADAIIRKYPVLFDTIEADLGVHYKDGRELLSGTVYFKNTPDVKMIVKCWISVIGNNPKVMDQKGLDIALQKYGSTFNIKVQNLPPQYTQIFDLMAHNGDPVIEHFQASRRFKNKMQTYHDGIPMSVGKMKVRQSADGSFFLPRANKQILDELNGKYCKVHGEYRWFPKSIGDVSLEDLRPNFQGKHCYIIGKGPSLDHLKASHFPDKDAVIIAINESIAKVEALNLPNKAYMMQQDAWLKNSCQPKHAGLLLAYTSRHWYAHCPDKYIFHYTHLGLDGNNLTVIYAITMAKKLGCTGLSLLCFDACAGAKLGYAKCVGYDPKVGGKPERFLTHRRAIDWHARGIKMDFVTPKDPAATASCILSL